MNYFENISLCKLHNYEGGNTLQIQVVHANLFVTVTVEDKVRLEHENRSLLLEFAIYEYDAAVFADNFIKFYGHKGVQNTEKDKSYLLRFCNAEEAEMFFTTYSGVKSKKNAVRCNKSKRKYAELLDDNQDLSLTNNDISTVQCDFDARTESSSAEQYFQFYGLLSQQQNMMQDYVRTSTYQRAIYDNRDDFCHKIIMDVGAGSGILSFFAAHASAKLVYAVEASSMALHCQELVRSNGMSNCIKVMTGKVEQIHIPEQVDVIVSEPMGYMLVNERMLESFMNARRFLKPGGKLFPTVAEMHFALFTDESLYLEQMQRVAFWFQDNFYGINLTSLREKAISEVFQQPVVDTWPIGILISKTVKWSIDFEKDPIEKLHHIEVPFALEVTRTCHVHGIASWFDVEFIGSKRKVWLSTSPSEPLTHWYQVRCMIPTPILVHAGQIVRGNIVMTANEKQSYDISITLLAGDTSTTGTFDLKMPHFRVGSNLYPPSGMHTESPSAVFLQNMSNMSNKERNDNSQ